MRHLFLILHNADAAFWARKHGITPFTTGCYACGEELTTSLPFACGHLRGLIAPPCKCGDALPPYCIVGDSIEDIMRGTT